MNASANDINNAIQAFLQRNNFQKTLNVFKTQLKNNRHGSVNQINVSQQKLKKFVRQMPKLNIRKQNQTQLREYLQATDQKSLNKIVDKMKVKLRSKNPNQKGNATNSVNISKLNFFKKLMQKENRNINQQQIITVDDLRESKINYNPLEESMQQQNEWHSPEDEGFQIIEQVKMNQLGALCRQINSVKHYDTNSIKQSSYPQEYYHKYMQIRQRKWKNMYDGLKSKLPPKIRYSDVTKSCDQIYPLECGDTTFGSFNMKVVYDRSKTGFQEDRDIKIIINEVLAGKYQVISNYGIGQFSKAIEVKDLTTGQNYCMKIISNNKYYFDQSIDEIKVLKLIAANCDTDECNLLTFHDFFYHKEHLMILTQLLKEDLYRTYQEHLDYFTLSTVQAISKQILQAVEKLHSLHIIHTDLKPQNILIKSYSNKTVKVIDLGSSIFFSDPLGFSVQTLTYRAPQVILGLPYDQKIDIWSIGCIIAEIFSGEVLFNGQNQTQILAKIQGLRGSWPSWMIQRGKFVHKYFTSDMVIFQPKLIAQQSESTFTYIADHFSTALISQNNNNQQETCRVYIPKSTNLKSRVGSDNKIFLDFLNKCLKIDPSQRLSAKQALNHPFILQHIIQ